MERGFFEPIDLQLFQILIYSLFIVLKIIMFLIQL